MATVVGIAGGTCSGKSTFSALLAEELQAHGTVVVIGLDKFYTRDVEKGPTLTLSDGTTMFNFNHPDAIDGLGAVAAIRGAGADFVIVEGLFTFAIPSIRELVDFTIFVHLDADLRALRRMLRDMKGGRASTDPEFIARYYIECARVGHTEFVEPSRSFAQQTVLGDSDGMGEGLVASVAAVLGA